MRQDVGSRKAPYPLFVRLDGCRVVVIGAGQVAERKVSGMLEYGADVTVVAPAATDAIAALADANAISWIRREYEHGDLAGAVLAIVATGNQSVNQAAFDEAFETGALVNVVDVPELCSCIVPSIMRRGQLQIAVSTNGAAPSVARELRRDLEERFPVWWEDYIDLLAGVRALVKERVPGPAELRTPLFEALGDADLEARFATGERLKAHDVYDEVIAPLLEGGVR